MNTSTTPPAPQAASARVFIDMDGVIVDFDAYKTERGLTGDEVKSMVGAYLAMPAIPGAIAAVRSVIGMGYEVWIATKPPTGVPHAYSDKAAWVMEHLPELKRRIIVTHDKGLLGGAGDFLLDDRPHKANCERFAGTLLRFVDGYHWPEALAELSAASPNANRSQRPTASAPKVEGGRDWNAWLSEMTEDDWTVLFAHRPDLKTRLAAALTRELPAEKRSTHHVHRGPESLPCYCAATTDHAIGRELPAAELGDSLEMRICEVPHVFLRPNQAYRFTVDTECKMCRYFAEQYQPNESPPSPACSGGDAELLRAVKELRGYEYRRGDLICQKSSMGDRCMCAKCIESRADTAIQSATPLHRSEEAS